MAHTVPTAANLKARYPAFADVADDTVDLWLTDAQRIVTTSWIEADYAPALMALAAHSLALGGYGAGEASLPAGVTRFRSGSLDVSVSEQAAAAAAKGGYPATVYGREFQVMLRRNRMTLGLVAAGAPVCGVYPS